MASGIPLTVLQSLGVTSPPPEKENSDINNVKPNSESSETVTKSTPVSEKKEENTDKDDEESVIVNMDHIIGELKALYIQQHGSDPGEEIIERWKNEVKNVEDLPLNDNSSTLK